MVILFLVTSEGFTRLVETWKNMHKQEKNSERGKGKQRKMLVLQRETERVRDRETEIQREAE